LRAFSKKVVYALATPAVINEFRSAGLTVYGPNDHETGPIEEIPLRPDIEAVVIAQDPSYEFRTIAIATRYAIEHKLGFYAVGNGASFPSGDGFVPGARALVAPIEVASKSSAVILGKPNVESIRFSLDLDRDEVLVIGSDIATDVPFAEAIGAKSILVVGEEREWESCAARPTFVCTNLLDARAFCS
jgi:ribonucleotide monophosphatase NagD (HAD superfamily)